MYNKEVIQVCVNFQVHPILKDYKSVYKVTQTSTKIKQFERINEHVKVVFCIRNN